jgi:hypothetical protein
MAKQRKRRAKNINCTEKKKLGIIYFFIIDKKNDDIRYFFIRSNFLFWFLQFILF